MGFDSVLPAVAVAAFAVAWGVTWLCCRPGSWLYFLDHPNARSLHVRPTPRTGGVGVMAGIAAAALVTIATGGAGRALLAALGGAFVLAGLGLADDRAGLSALLRLLAQVLVAGGFLALAGLAGGAMGLLLLLGLVWMGNLYNFMDGIDGMVLDAKLARGGAHGGVAFGAEDGVLGHQGPELVRGVLGVVYLENEVGGLACTVTRQQHRHLLTGQPALAGLTPALARLA